MNKVLLAIVVPCLVSCIILMVQGQYNGYGAGYQGYGGGYGYGGGAGGGFPPAAQAYNYGLARRSVGDTQRAADVQSLLKSLAALVFAVAYYSFQRNSTGNLLLG